jgi:hypothetical protein
MPLCKQCILCWVSLYLCIVFLLIFSYLGCVFKWDSVAANIDFIRLLKHEQFTGEVSLVSFLFFLSSGVN